jgi:hypothetical protein
VAMQEYHDLPDDLLLGPGNSNAARPHRADAVHLPQAVGLGLDDVEHLVPEGAQQLLGIDRADAADHARGQGFLDAFDRGRGGGLEEPGLELLAVGAVVRPVANGRNPLTGRNHGGVANDRDEIAVTARLDPNDAKAIVGILVGDALNQPGQHFPIGWLWLRLHDGHRSVVAKTLAPDAKVQRNPAAPGWNGHKRRFPPSGPECWVKRPRRYHARVARGEGTRLQDDNGAMGCLRLTGGPVHR